MSVRNPGGDGDELLRQGRLAFNRGEFFRAHDLWEEVWRVRRTADRGLLQGLIQIAAGCHHLQCGRSAPAARLLARGISRVSAGAVAGAVDVAVLFVDSPLPAFVDGVSRLRDALSQGRDAPLTGPATLKL